MNDRAVRCQESVSGVNRFAALASRKGALVSLTRSLLLALTLLGIEVLGLLGGHGCGGGYSFVLIGIKIGPGCRIARNFSHAGRNRSPRKPL